MLMFLPILVLTQSAADAQKSLDAQYHRWDKAIVSHDQKTLEAILAPSFVAKIKGTVKTLDKKEFISAITNRWKVKDAPKEKLFTTKINKVTVNKGFYLANIDESVTLKSKDGRSKQIDFKSLDTWIKVGKSWQIVATEPAN